MKKFFYIEVNIYRLAVIVTWETTKEQLFKYSEQHGCKLSDESKELFDDVYKGIEHKAGWCAFLGKDNSDVVIWLKNKPETSKNYAFLYHELYHAVQRIIETRDLHNEE